MVVTGVVVVLMGFGVNAFAETGGGSGMGGGSRMGGGSGMGGGAGMGGGRANLTDGQIKQMQSEQTAFRAATEDIRQQITEKRQALYAELAKQTPDATTAKDLQKEISDLQSQFDEKRLTHILEMKKIDPNFTERRGMGQDYFRRGQAN
jgi:Spy/CpxP family protein refolding chaperone